MMCNNQKGFPTVFAFAMVTLLSCCFSPVSSFFALPRVTRTSDAIIIDCKFSFSSSYTIRIVTLISWIFFLIVFKFQMMVWDILLSPWTEATAKLLIQDSFHFPH
jgi:hypothetical protein